MSAVRTLSAVGAALGRELPALARSAAEHLTLPSVAGSPEIESTLERLLDRLCLSLTLAKPVGLASWAEMQAAKDGRAAVLDIAAAGAHAISVSATRYDIEPQKLLGFLGVLCREIERAALDAEEQNDRESVVEDDSTSALLAMLGERDYDTCCHSKATSEWARRLALALGCDAEAAEFIGLCGLLHDVGKISTPESILRKAAPLSADEWDIMRDHAAAGARILNQIPSLQRCSMVVRAHHERYDGAGYPDGLAGACIPFEARVVSVADAFLAMITDRPYRRAITPRQALKLLEEGRGSQWDPEVVDAMLSMFHRRADLQPVVGSKVSFA